MTPPQGSGQKPPETTVYRPGLGRWLGYWLILAVAGFLVWVSFYEDRTAQDRLLCLVAAVGPVLLLLDLGVARVELDHRSVRIRGLGLLHKSAEFTYREVESPPEAVVPTPLAAKPILQQRLANGRLVKFPVWLGAQERREIIGKIEAHRKGHVV
jgi:hypothetical protein